MVPYHHYHSLDSDRVVDRTVGASWIYLLSIFSLELFGGLFSLEREREIDRDGEREIEREGEEEV